MARALLVGIVTAPPCGGREAYRTPARLEHATRDALLDASRHGLRVTALDAAALAAQEPALGPGFCGALHWLDPKSVVDPGALVKAYARLFARDGGTLLEGDAATLEAGDGGWRVRTAEGVAAARDVVVALGPWSDTVFAKLGYRLPLREKRGYHMHYAPPDGAPLSAPVVDLEHGYVVAPMRRGLRLTTGVEIAARTLPPTGVQLARAERVAQPTFRLGRRLDAAPWLGFRPCTPDMRPVIGAAPRHRGIWFAFGHNHHGLTLGPITGRLLAEMMCGGPTVANVAPFRAERFL
ncbi:FAD-dependent oxidoreductase [Burkholderia pseudomallei]|nr:FAD-dependent oxidoreductase [Burkholderia pseudomallei]